MDEQELKKVLRELLPKVTTAHELLEEDEDGEMWKCNFRKIEKEGFLAWQTNAEDVAFATVSTIVHLRAVSGLTEAQIIHLLNEGAEMINGAFTYHGSAEEGVLSVVRRSPASVFEPSTFQKELRELVRQAEILLSSVDLDEVEAEDSDEPEDAESDEEAPERPTDECAYTKWPGDTPARCRDCSEDCLVENFEADEEYSCPNCEHDESYQFCAVCPSCEEFNAFHLGSNGAALMEIGKRALQGYVNPLEAAANIAKLVGNLSKKEGIRGVCSMCDETFVACPKCATLNADPDSEIMMTCRACNLRFRNP